MSQISVTGAKSRRHRPAVRAARAHRLLETHLLAQGPTHRPLLRPKMLAVAVPYRAVVRPAVGAESPYPGLL